MTDLNEIRVRLAAYDTARQSYHAARAHTAPRRSSVESREFDRSLDALLITAPDDIRALLARVDALESALTLIEHRAQYYVDGPHPSVEAAQIMNAILADIHTILGEDAR